MARTLLAAVAVASCLLFQPAHAVVPPLPQPSWVELTAEQREILAPLAGEWDQFEASRRKKWLGIAERYPAMAAQEQARVQRRMIDWVKLSPEERKLAREKYKNLQKSPQEHKETVKQKWQEYKELPAEERERLQAEAAAKAAAKPKPMPRKALPSPAGSGQKPPALPVPALATPAAIAPAPMPVPPAPPQASQQ